MNDQKIMIDMHNVSKWYGKFQVLTDCTTQIRQGEVVVVCGPSGSGKSTLIKTVNGLETIQQGQILVDDIAIKLRRRALARFPRTLLLRKRHWVVLIPPRARQRTSCAARIRAGNSLTHRPRSGRPGVRRSG